jgi:hypothetical protein
MLVRKGIVRADICDDTGVWIKGIVAGWRVECFRDGKAKSVS